MFFRDPEYDAEEATTGTTTASQFVATGPAEDLTTSRGRFYSRLERWKKDGKAFPRTRHHVQWLIHNCVVHPLIAVAPVTFLLELHELSSRWLNVPRRTVETDGVSKYLHGRSFVLTSPVIPKAKSRFFWLLHNTAGHILIGLLPIRPFFFFHDWSAKQMGAPNWF